MAFSISHRSLLVEKKRYLKMKKKYNILIVDDDPQQLHLISIYLRDERYNIFTAKNGRHALKKLESETIDLVLTDNQMPEMDGQTLILKIRKELGLKIPILIISANETDKTLVKLKNVSILRKPFTSDQVKKLIKNYLD